MRSRPRLSPLVCGLAFAFACSAPRKGDAEAPAQRSKETAPLSQTLEPRVDDSPTTQAEADATPRVAPPVYGVALSFDDDFVDQWYAIRDLLRKYGAKATFYTTRYHKLSDERKRKLRELQDEGHEIGYHTVSHANARDYLLTHTVEEYVAQEIDPDLALMRADGLKLTTFAYPWGGYTPETDRVLAERFALLRKSGRLANPRFIFDPRLGKRITEGASIDVDNFDAAKLDEALTQVGTTKDRVAVIYAHQIVDKPIATRSHILKETLERVLADIARRKLPFLTMAQIAPDPRIGQEVIYQSLVKGSVESADKILQDIWPVDRFPDTAMPGGPQWTEDPYNEKYWRFIFYALRPMGNLIHAYRTTGETRYMARAARILDGFFAHDALKNPAVADPHTSAFLQMMLIALRAGIRDAGLLTPALDAKIVAAIADRGAFLADDANFEGGYNHGLNEAAALLLTAVVQPDAPKAEAWRALALKRLRQVVDDTIDADGVQVEQSPFYHFYVLKFLWEISAWSREHRIDLGDLALEGVIRKMLDFSTYIIQPDGAIPHISASTDFNVRSSFYREYHALSPAFAFAQSAGAMGRPAAAASRLFPASGFAVLRTPWEAGPAFAKASHVVFDVGPFRTNHSQLDALNLTFYAERPLLVDSGLYSYEKGPLRDYYNGTRAHNTVTVDGKDQAKGSATALTSALTGPWAYQSAKHELYKDVVHTRGVLLVAKNVLLVLDRLEAQARDHDYELNWHLAPDLAARREADGSVFAAPASGEGAVRLMPLAPTGQEPVIVRGQEAPFRQGWVSKLYEKEEPATVVAYTHKGRKVTYATLVTAGAEASAGAVAATVDAWDGETLHVTLITTVGKHVVRVERFGREGETVDVQTP